MESVLTLTTTTSVNSYRVLSCPTLLIHNDYAHPHAHARNLVPRAHVPFGQLQDTELWNNQFAETKILGLPVSRRMRGFVYMASRDKVDVNTLHKGIQYALEKLGKSKFGFERTAVSI